MAKAQQQVTGRVVDKSSGEPLAGVTVATDDDLVATDDAGNFVLLVEPPIKVSVYADGFVTRTLVLRKSGVTIKLAIDESLGQIFEIKEKFEDNVGPKKYRIGKDELKVIPGSGGDPLIAIQNTPGAARIPVGLGGLVLRGSSPRDSLVVLDNVRVPLLYHFGGIRSFYQADLLKSVDVLASGFDGRFGRAQGGLVEVVSDSGVEAESWKVGGQISLTDSSTVIYGPMAGGSWALGARRSYLDLVLRPFVPEDTALPIYSDGQARWQRNGEKYSHIVNLFGSFDTSESDSFLYKNNFGRLLHQMSFSPAESYELRTTAYVGVDTVGVEDKEEAEEALGHKSWVYGARVEASRAFDGGKLVAGLELDGRRFDYNFGNFDDDTTAGLATGEIWENNVAAYVVGNVGLWEEAFQLAPSLRVERLDLSDEFVIDPRLSLRQQIRPGLSLKQSVGIYHQPPRPVDQAHLTSNPDIKSSHALQSSFGIEYSGITWLELSATAFASSLRDLPAYVIPPGETAQTTPPRVVGPGAVFFELINDQFGYFGYQENVGSGRAHGVELFARVTKPKWFGWISYTYSRAYRTDDPSQFPDERLYLFDQPHNLTMLASYKYNNWRFGARFRAISGNPYTPVVGRFWDVDSNRWRRIDGAPFSDRLGAFISLDLRVDHTWELKSGELSLFLDLRNALNRANPEFSFYNNDYSEQGVITGIPIFPSFGLEYKPK